MRSSSTRRCTRKRCSTCGIGCRFEQKRRPDGYRPRVDGRPRRPTSGSTFPAARATLGVDRGDDAVRLGQRAPGARRVQVPAFRIERHDVTNAAFLEFVDAGGYGDQRWWAADDWQWLAANAVAHPLFWERDGGPGAGAACSIACRCPQPGRCTSATPKRRRTRAGAARGCRPKPSSSAPRSDRRRRRARASVGDDAAGDRRTASSTSASWDPEPAGSHPDGRQRMGRRGSGRQRMGVDDRRRSRRSPASRRCRRIRNTRPTSSTASTS